MPPCRSGRTPGGWRASLSYINQAKSLTVCRRETPEMAAVPVAIQRGTLKRVDEQWHFLKDLASFP